MLLVGIGTVLGAIIGIVTGIVGIALQSAEERRFLERYGIE